MQRILNSTYNTDKQMSLYIHIPFCVSKCTYCDFCSFVAKPNVREQYLLALHQEIITRAQQFPDYHITSIYIGGGTPSLLSSTHITSILDAIRQNFILSPNTSITVEVNPNSFTPEFAFAIARAGATRVSIGLQSANSKLLHMLNRPHNYTDFERAVYTATHVGIHDINADILLGIPTQTMQDVTDTLHKLSTLPLTHISAYGIILEPNTPLTHSVQLGKLPQPDENLGIQMYKFTNHFLNKCGFTRYEISNFAKTGYQSQHNLNYWQRGQYLGLGLNSHSFLNGYHWQNTPHLHTYLANPINSIMDVELQTTSSAKFETIMLALRLTQGLDILAFNTKFNTNFLQEYQHILTPLLEQGVISIQHNTLRILDFNISNSIISMFV